MKRPFRGVDLNRSNQQPSDKGSGLRRQNYAAREKYRDCRPELGTHPDLSGWLEQIANRMLLIPWCSMETALDLDKYNVRERIWFGAARGKM
jgi:hypothetical protein